MHERVFMFHDLSHFLMPDLVYTGGSAPLLTADASSSIPSSLIRRVYISARLVSEAVTLVLGDMTFVDEMMAHGLLYKTYQARRIYPIYALIKDRVAELGERGVYQAIKGSVEYCWRKDFSTWQEMATARRSTGGAGEQRGEAGEPGSALLPHLSQTFAQFGDKYDAYFLEDFRWTRLNYESMAADEPEHRARWWRETGEIREAMRARGMELDLYSVDEWIGMHGLREEMGHEELTQRVFDSVYSRYVAPVVRQGHEETLLPRETRLLKSFVRYMIGQSRIFFRMDALLPDSTRFWEVTKRALLAMIETHGSSASPASPASPTSGILAFYRSYLELLGARKLISADDVTVYGNIYPLFSPVICDYDHLDEQTTLDQFVRTMLLDPAARVRKHV